MAVTPNALDVGDTRLLEVVPDARREERDTVTLRNRKEWWVAEQDRVVTIKDSLYPNDTLFAAVCVIAGPLAEGSLHLRLFFRWRYLPLDHNFRSRRHRKSGKRSPYHFHRFTAQRAGVIVLAHPSLGRRWCRGPSRWLTAQNNRHGTRALCLPVFSRDLLAVFMVNDPQRESVLIDDAGAVGADVDPTAVRVFGDNHIASADVTPAIVLVPLRRWEYAQVDAIAFQNIICHWG